MQNKWKLIATTAVLLCGVVNADDGDDKSSYGNKKKMQPMMRQGEIITADQMQSGYNAPAGINAMGDWDMYVRASYIFWDFFQDGMSIGVTSTVQPTFSTTAPQPGTGTLNFDDTYKSGFKVAMGWNTDFDNWTVDAEYTWFHNQISQGQGSSNPFLLVTLALPLNTGAKNNAQIFKSSVSTWRMHMDLGDLMLSRPFYQGTHLTVNPFGGVRGAWIRQTQAISGYTVDTAAGFPATAITATSHSWAVGPRMGMGCNWLLGDGFRVEGSTSMSLLFTQYRTRYTANSQSSTIVGFSVERKNQNTLRPNADAMLGLAWGNYFSNQTYYLDVALDYTFNMWWSQNVIGNYIDALTANSSQGTGDLYLHGLTATVRFDF